ncbi:S1C family serine protease [Quadrisphaera sp. GCM10027208]|uniref:S1C family serine protease n=1 Tax=Quadrisphaera sp. GCM10027208 TaxID=3273423 RepID=UPI003615B007
MTTPPHDPWAQRPPTEPPGPQQPAEERRRGPGWGGTIAAAVLSALLAAGGTAGLVTALDDDPSPAPPAAGTESDQGTTDQPDAASSAPAPAGQVDWTPVAERVAPSVVSIDVRGRTGAGQGSGVVIDDAGHVLTNNHVVAGGGSGAQVRISLDDGRVLDAEVLGTDPTTDLAVLAVPDMPDDVPAIDVGDSGAVQVGQPVMALGNPLGLSQTITTGIVSAVDRPVTTQSVGGQPFEPGVPVVTNAIQTDAAINPGNSGGALVDAAGRLIGINSSIASLGQGGQAGSIGLGFAIPVDQARWVAQSLIETGAVEHAYLGVSLEDGVVEVDGVPREAAGIATVVPGTPAEQAGLSAGEAVVAVDGEPVPGAESLVAQVRERQPGTEVTLSVVGRDGEVREVTVEFGVRP